MPDGPPSPSVFKTRIGVPIGWVKPKHRRSCDYGTARESPQMAQLPHLASDRFPSNASILYAQPPLAPELPIYIASRHHHAADLPSKLLLQRRSPGDELEAESIVDHCKAAGCKCDALPVDARDMLAFGGWAMSKPCFCRQFGGCIMELALAQSIDKIADEDDPLALPPGQASLDKMIDPAVHRCTDFGAKAAAAQGGFLREQLTVEPGGTWRFDLRLDRQVGSGGKTPARLAASSITVPSASAFNRHSASGNASRSWPRFSIPAMHLRPRQAAQWCMLDPKVFQVSFARGDATTKLGVITAPHLTVKFRRQRMNSHEPCWLEAVARMG